MHSSKTINNTEISTAIDCIKRLTISSPLFLLIVSSKHTSGCSCPYYLSHSSPLLGIRGSFRLLKKGKLTRLW